MMTTAVLSLNSGISNAFTLRENMNCITVQMHNVCMQFTLSFHSSGALFSYSFFFLVVFVTFDVCICTSFQNIPWSLHTFTNNLNRIVLLFMIQFLFCHLTCNLNVIHFIPLLWNIFSFFCHTL